MAPRPDKGRSTSTAGRTAGWPMAARRPRRRRLHGRQRGDRVGRVVQALGRGGYPAASCPAPRPVAVPHRCRSRRSLFGTEVATGWARPSPSEAVRMARLPASGGEASRRGLERTGGSLCRPPGWQGRLPVPSERSIPRRTSAPTPAMGRLCARPAARHDDLTAEKPWKTAGAPVRS